MPRVGPVYFGFTEDANASGLKSVIDKLEVLMALDKTTQDKIDALKAQLTAAAEGLTADIADLKAKVGSGATPEEVNAALDGIAAKVQPLTDLDAENPNLPVI